MKITSSSTNSPWPPKLNCNNQGNNVTKIIHDNKGREIKINFRKVTRGSRDTPSRITFVVRTDSDQSTEMEVMIPEDGTLYDRRRNILSVMKSDWSGNVLILEAMEAISAVALKNGTTLVCVEATPHTAYHTMALVWNNHSAKSRIPRCGFFTSPQTRGILKIN